MTSPAIGIKDLLVAAGIGTFNATTGWCIRVEGEEDQPDESITCYLSGGLEPNPKWLLDYPSVQVRVRSKPGDTQGAYTKALAVKNALLGKMSFDLNGDRWVSIRMMGDIFNLGFDDRKRPIRTLNFTLIIEPAAGTNRDPL